MRSTSSRCLLVLALCAPSLSSYAQVLITPDDDVLIEQYIVGQPALPPPVVIEENITLRPGVIVPPGVPLRPFGGAGNLAKYAYFVSVDNKVVVVDPTTRAVVRITNARR